MAADHGVALRLELKALLGGLVATWEQEAWIDGRTTQVLAIRVPEALVQHPEAEGMPLVVFGVARTGSQSLAIPPWRAVIRAREGARVLEPGALDRPVPDRPGLFPPRAPGRAVQGRPSDDPSADTGLNGGAP